MSAVDKAPERIWADQDNLTWVEECPGERMNGDEVAYIRADLSAPSAQEGQPITMTYRNYRGEVADRTVTPKRIWWGSTDWHPEPGWLLTAHDPDKQADRDFALADADFRRSSPSAPAEVEGLVEPHHEQIAVWADELMSDLALHDLLTINDYDDKVIAAREIREKLTLCAAHRDDALTALQADKAALIEARDMMGRLWEQEKARAEKAEAERDALIEAGMSCCTGTPNPELPRVGLAISFIQSTRDALGAADRLWRDYKAELTEIKAALTEARALIARRTKERDQARAETAAAYEKAALCAPGAETISARIRALTPADAKAALAEHVQRAVEAETRACAEAAQSIAERRPLVANRPTDLVRGRYQGEQAMAGFICSTILARLDQPKGGEGKA